MKIFESKVITRSQAVIREYPLICGVSLTRFLLSFSMGGVISVLLPLIKDEFSVGYTELGLLISAFAFARLIMDLPLGYLSDRFDNLSLLAVGMICVFGGVLICLFAPTFTLLVCGRILVGIGSGINNVAALTLLTRDAQRGSLGKINSLLEFSAIAGTSISPSIAGFLATSFQWRATFVLSAITSLISFFVVFWIKNNTGSSAKKHGKMPLEELPSSSILPISYRQLVSQRGILVGYVTAFMFSWSWGGFLSTLFPLYGSDVLGLSVKLIGLSMTVAALADLALLIPVGWLSDRYNRKPFLIGGLFCILLGILALPLAKGLPLFMLFCIIVYMGFAAWGMPPALLADLSSPESRGKVIGVYRFLVDAGFAIGPSVSAALTNHFGYVFTASLTALLLGLTMLGIIMFLPRGKFY